MENKNPHPHFKSVRAVCVQLKQAMKVGSAGAGLAVSDLSSMMLNTWKDISQVNTQSNTQRGLRGQRGERRSLETAEFQPPC